jgi:hypothetical protein
MNSLPKHDMIITLVIIATNEKPYSCNAQKHNRHDFEPECHTRSAYAQDKHTHYQHHYRLLENSCSTFHKADIYDGAR